MCGLQNCDCNSPHTEIPPQLSPEESLPPAPYKILTLQYELPPADKAVGSAQPVEADETQISPPVLPSASVASLSPGDDRASARLLPESVHLARQASALFEHHAASAPPGAGYLYLAPDAASVKFYRDGAAPYALAPKDDDADVIIIDDDDDDEYDGEGADDDDDGDDGRGGGVDDDYDGDGDDGDEDDAHRGRGLTRSGIDAAETFPVGGYHDTPFIPPTAPSRRKPRVKPDIPRFSQPAQPVCTPPVTAFEVDDSPVDTSSYVYQQLLRRKGLLEIRHGKGLRFSLRKHLAGSEGKQPAVAAVASAWRPAWQPYTNAQLTATAIAAAAAAPAKAEKSTAAKSTATTSSNRRKPRMSPATPARPALTVARLVRAVAATEARLGPGRDEQLLFTHPKRAGPGPGPGPHAEPAPPQPCSEDHARSVAEVSRPASPGSRPGSAAAAAAEAAAAGGREAPIVLSVEIQLGESTCDSIVVRRGDGTEQISAAVGAFVEKHGLPQAYFATILTTTKAELAAIINRSGSDAVITG